MRRSGYEGRRFSTWLEGISRHFDLEDPTKLRAVLASNDCYCNESALAQWMSGASEPSFEKMRSILSALQRARPDVDVWENYRTFIQGGAPSDAGGGVTSRNTEATLDALLRDSPGLPPGLSE